MTGTVMITAGGTGGHVFPGLAVAAKLVARGWRVFWLGTRDGMEGALVRRHGVEFEGVAFRGIRGKGWQTAVLGPFALVGACWQSRRIIRRRAPDVVLGFGGFASVPGALAGLAAARPLVLHDANAIAGLANRVLAYAADRVLLGFPGAMRGRHARQGRMGGQSGARRDRPRAAARSPLRRPRRDRCDSSSSAAASARRRSIAAFRRRSRGCRRRSRPQVVHQSGARHVDALRAAYDEAGVAAQCVPFIDDMASHYADADIVLCRGGAITVAELAAVGVAAIIVPLPGRDRRRAERERAVSRRRGRGAEDRRGGPDAGTACREPRLVHARRAARDGGRRRASRRAPMPRIASPTRASRCGSGR